MRVKLITKHHHAAPGEYASRLGAYQDRLKELRQSLLDDDHLVDEVRLEDCHTCMEDTKDFDVVVVFGGDGTLLSVHQHVEDTPVLPVRGDSGSVGSLLNHVDPSQAASLLSQEAYREESWGRVRVDPFGVLGLNEIYFGPLYATGNAHFRVEGVDAHASGLVVATGCGSTAWYAELGGDEFPRTSQEPRYVTREASTGRLSGRVGSDGVEVENRATRKAVVAADGADPDHFFQEKIERVAHGETMVFKPASPLRVLLTE